MYLSQIPLSENLAIVCGECIHLLYPPISASDLHPGRGRPSTYWNATKTRSSTRVSGGLQFFDSLTWVPLHRSSNHLQRLPPYFHEQQQTSCLLVAPAHGSWVHVSCVRAGSWSSHHAVTWNPRYRMNGDTMFAHEMLTPGTQWTEAPGYFGRPSSLSYQTAVSFHTFTRCSARLGDQCPIYVDQDVLGQVGAAVNPLSFPHVNGRLGPNVGVRVTLLPHRVGQSAKQVKSFGQYERNRPNCVLVSRYVGSRYVAPGTGL